MSIARQVITSFFRRCIMINTKLVSLIMEKQRNVSSNFSPAFPTDKIEIDHMRWRNISCRIQMTFHCIIV